MDASTRQEKLKSAKQKLKQYRAKQAKASRSSLDSQSAHSDASPVRAAFAVSAHRRSLSRRHSRTDSLLALQQHVGQSHSKRPATTTVVIDLDAAPPAKHSRRPSRHSRQLSIGTRKESMDIMSGLIASGSIISNPAFLAAGASPDLLHRPDALSPGPSFPFSSPKTPQHLGSSDDGHRRDFHRTDALDALEGRLGPAAQDSSSYSPSHLSKRSSWGSSAASAMAIQGGKGALDLGMLVEESEEDEDDSLSTDKTTTPPPQQQQQPQPPERASKPGQPPRTRPASLRLSSHSSLGTAVNVPSPLDLSNFATPDTATTTPGSSSAGSSSYAGPLKPLKSLSLSASTPADAFQSVAIPAVRTRTATQQHRTSAGGLRSLTLTSPHVEPIGLPPTTPQRRRSSMHGGLASSASSSSAGQPKRRPPPPQASGSFSASGRRMSYRAATPDETMFGRLVMDDESLDDSRSEASHIFSDNSFQSQSQSHSAAGAEAASLRLQVDALQAEAAALRSELSAAKFQVNQLQAEQQAASPPHAAEARAWRYRLFEVEGQLEAKRAELLAEHEGRRLDLDRLAAELADARDRLADAAGERDGLREDVDGWRARCAALERAVQAERAAKDEERKQSLVAREKVRKLGDQLAALSGSDRRQSDTALAAAQAKLIGEMRDQIFAMAAALEAEKQAGQAHALAAQQLQHQLLEQQQQQLAQSRSHTASDASGSTRSQSTSAGSFATEATDEAAYGTEITATSPLAKSYLGLSINLGSLHAVAEEDEEATSASASDAAEAAPPAALDEADWVDDGGDDVPELDFRGTQTQAQARLAAAGSSKLGSTSSSVADEPTTPCRASPVPTGPPAPGHNRSHSFIKQWTFPKGPVEPVYIFEPDDHSFFSISTAEILPPLPLSQEALELPVFFTSDLVIDEAAVRKSLEVQQPPKHGRRPSSPRPKSQRFSPMRASFSSSANGPPTARSARLSAALSEASHGSYSSKAVAKAPSRMSLQGISSLITAYVAPTPATVMPKVAYAAAGLCAAHTREESIFADDDRALLLRPLSMMSTPSPVSARVVPMHQPAAQKATGPPRPVPKAQQARPFASPLRLLDFIGSFGLRSEQVLHV